MTARPRFRFVTTLGVHAPADAARQILAEGLGFHEVSSDQGHIAFANADSAIFVDTTEASAGFSGFIPMFACDDLLDAREFLRARGCTLRPMPWSGPGLVVEGPGGLRFCIAQTETLSGHASNAADLDANAWDGTDTAASPEFEVTFRERSVSEETLAGQHTPPPSETAARELSATDALDATRSVSRAEIESVFAKMAALDLANDDPNETREISRKDLVALMRAAGFARDALERAKQPDSEDLETTALGLRPPRLRPQVAPSMVDPAADDPPYSEFDLEDPTMTTAPSRSLLGRAGPSVDVTAKETTPVEKQRPRHRAPQAVPDFPEPFSGIDHDRAFDDDSLHAAPTSADLAAQKTDAVVAQSERQQDALLDAEREREALRQSHRPRRTRPIRAQLDSASKDIIGVRADPRATSTGHSGNAASPARHFDDAFDDAFDADDDEETIASPTPDSPDRRRPPVRPRRGPGGRIQERSDDLENP